MQSHKTIWIRPRTLLVISILVLASLTCSLPVLGAQTTPTPVDRLSVIPASAIKQEPASDPWPPEIVAGWSQPVPLGAPVDTAGGEDSPFITPDGEMLYFFFTPDVTIPAEKQLLDGVTGIWMAHRSGDQWSDPQRVVLEKPGEQALDGCPFVLGDLMYFCSARTGSLRGVDLYTAELFKGAWSNWQDAGKILNLDYQVGEMHLSADGKEMYFGSRRSGGQGGSDLWVSQWTGSGWGVPVNLGVVVNSAGDEDRPYVSPDGKELWFDGTSRKSKTGPAVFRSSRQADGSWGPPEEIVSTLAGEPTLSGDGQTLYFVHHFFSPNMQHMLEADIYVSYRVR